MRHVIDSSIVEGHQGRACDLGRLSAKSERWIEAKLDLPRKRYSSAVHVQYLRL